MPRPPADLAAYAARLLVGTTITPETAPLTAAGRRRADGPVAAALRDGWVSGEDLPVLPAPSATSDDDHDDSESDGGGGGGAR